MRVEPVAETSGTRGSAARASPTSRPPMTSCDRPSGASPKRARARSSTAWVARAVSGVFSDGFQITGSPQTRASAGVPGPDGDGEVEGRDDADRPQRLPGLAHVVAGPLAGDGQAVELARQADGEVADVDHLLHLAEALGGDLAGLERDQRGEVVLGRRAAPRRAGGPVRRGAGRGRGARRRRRRSRRRGRLRSRRRRRCAPAGAVEPSIGERVAIPAGSKVASDTPRRVRRVRASSGLRSWTAA